MFDRALDREGVGVGKNVFGGLKTSVVPCTKTFGRTLDEVYIGTSIFVADGRRAKLTEEETFNTWAEFLNGGYKPLSLAGPLKFGESENGE
jgi:hypothetical protein